MRRLLRLAAALLVAVASGDTAPPPEEPEPMASSNTLGGEFIVAAAAAPEPDAEEVDAAGEAAAAFEARRAALSEAMAPPDDYDASGEDDAVLEEMIREQEAAAAAQARADAEAARDAETAKAAVAEAERADAAAAAAAAPEPEPAPEPPQRPATASRANANFRTSTEDVRHERRSDLPPATADRRAPERKPGAPPLEGDTTARLEDLLARGQADAAAEAAALEAQKARRKHDPAYEARRAQAWGELSPWERRRCDDEVDRVRKLADRGHYAVLGLRRSAPAAAVKQKYRQKALLVHPDKNPSPDAQLAFDALREAHEILGDEAKRRDYDRRMRRKAEVRRQRIVREVRAIVETAAEYVAYRSRDAPKLFYSAVAVAFLLV